MATAGIGVLWGTPPTTRRPGTNCGKSRCWATGQSVEYPTCWTASSRWRCWLAPAPTTACSRSRWTEAAPCLPCHQPHQRREEAAAGAAPPQ